MQVKSHKFTGLRVCWVRTHPLKKRNTDKTHVKTGTRYWGGEPTVNYILLIMRAL